MRNVVLTGPREIRLFDIRRRLRGPDKKGCVPHVAMGVSPRLVRCLERPCPGKLGAQALPSLKLLLLCACHLREAIGPTAPAPPHPESRGFDHHPDMFQGNGADVSLVRDISQTLSSLKARVCDVMLLNLCRLTHELCSHASQQLKQAALHAVVGRSHDVRHSARGVTGSRLGRVGLWRRRRTVVAAALFEAANIFHCLFHPQPTPPTR